jgi:peptidoglycan/LPS O-acetylase OafA/YrhL
MELTLPTSTVITDKSERRVPGIDVLRGLCILAVVLHHINLRIHFRDSNLGHWIGPAANRALFWSGYYGVRVFFVISGFLITSWSLKRWGKLAQINRRQFYVMRFARIVPCLVGLLLVLSLLDRLGVSYFIVSQQHSTLTRALFAALTFHVNWLEAHTGYLPANWDVLWSLSVEEVFYIFFPVLCTMLRKQWLLLSLLCSLVIIGPFARILPKNDLWQDYGYLACMDGIALGCLAAIFSAKIKLSARTNLILGACGAALCLFIDVLRGPASHLGLYKIGLDVTMLQVGTALLVIVLQQNFESKSARQAASLTDPSTATQTTFQQLAKTLFRSTAWLRWFGRNSYEVYLTHMLAVWPMVMLFWHFKQSINTAPWWFLATTIFAGILGGLVARFYSEPLNHKFRVKLLPSHNSRAATEGIS